MRRLNLKKVLMELGNRLVLEHRFAPATCPTLEPKNTHVIKTFTEWLNDTPEAQAILANMDIDWPLVAEPPPSYER